MIDNFDIPKHIINKIVENAIAEDLGSLGDITSKSLSRKKTNHPRNSLKELFIIFMT